MDKQMIEEIVSVLTNASCKGYECEKCALEMDNGFASCVCAKAIYNAGYRKIPENAVVIEKTVYDKLLILADECIDWRRKNCNVGELPKENVVVLTEGSYSELLSDEVESIKKDIAEYWATQDVDIVAKELHKDGYRKLDDHAIFVLRKAKGLEEKVRKETAEKFAERLKEELENRSPIAGYDLEDLEFDGEIIQECIDEIAKEITEGKV